jgi:hypothetical protein
MAKHTVGLYLSVTIEKRQKYLPLRLPHKAGWGVLKGVPTEFHNPTYVLRFSDNGRRVWDPVGRDLNEALTAKKWREQIQGLGERDWRYRLMARQSCQWNAKPSSPLWQRMKPKFPILRLALRANTVKTEIPVHLL